ncbi:unnamed protein product [Ectocarpus sp. 6 AP-2014]
MHRITSLSADGRRGGNGRRVGDSWVLKEAIQVAVLNATCSQPRMFSVLFFRGLLLASFEGTSRVEMLTYMS